MFLLSICGEEPRLDTMPVLKTTVYPWTEGSYRPLCYARCAAVPGRGILFDLQSFLRDPFVGDTGDLLDDSCVAFSFRFFPAQNEDIVTAVLNSRGSYAVFINGVQAACTFAVTRYAGADEQGWYWGVRFWFTEELLERFCGAREIPDGHRLAGNLYAFKRAGSDAYMAAVAPMAEPFIFSAQNLAPFEAVAY